MTALHIAFYEKQTEIALLLIAADANHTICDNKACKHNLLHTKQTYFFFKRGKLASIWHVNKKLLL